MNDEIKRRQTAKHHSFEDQLIDYKRRLERELSGLQEGPEKAAIQIKISQLERAIGLNQRLSK
jgi:hypothetical protein